MTWFIIVIVALFVFSFIIGVTGEESEKDMHKRHLREREAKIADIKKSVHKPWGMSSDDWDRAIRREYTAYYRRRKEK
jgi:hypothetical protein